jgi:hypothetical protein
MMMLEREALANGLELLFRDESNRYFGDYHRVCVIATIVCPVGAIEDPELQRQVSDVFGEQLLVEKQFERMGVASADVDKVRQALVDDFVSHALNYLSRPDYPRLLALAELKKRRSNRFYV